MEAARDRGASWKATFLSQGGATFLHLRDPRDRATADRVRRMIEEQPASIHRLFRIIDRQELDAVGAVPEVPFALAASLGVTFSDRGDGEVLGPATGGTHGYFPHDFPQIQTGFVGWGAGFRRGRGRARDGSAGRGAVDRAHPRHPVQGARRRRSARAAHRRSRGRGGAALLPR